MDTEGGNTCIVCFACRVGGKGRGGRCTHAELLLSNQGTLDCRMFNQNYQVGIDLRAPFLHTLAPSLPPFRPLPLITS